MAKESMKAREVKRAKLVEKYSKKRAELKEIIRKSGLEYTEEKEAAIKALQQLPPNSNAMDFCFSVDSAFSVSFWIGYFSSSTKGIVSLVFGVLKISFTV